MDIYTLFGALTVSPVIFALLWCVCSFTSDWWRHRRWKQQHSDYAEKLEELGRIVNAQHRSLS